MDVRSLQQLIVERTPQQLSLQGPLSPGFIFLWKLALERKAIDPDVALIESIAQAQTRASLLLIALSLRHGGNPNMYVATPGVGTIHLLGYVYAKLLPTIGTADPELIELIVAMLVIAGSKPVMPIFDPSGGKINPTGLPDPRKATMDVPQWLREQGVIGLLEKLPPNLYSTLNPAIANELAVLLDRVDLKPSVTNTELSSIIKAFSDHMLTNMKIVESWRHDGLDYVSLKETVIYYNRPAFIYLLDQGLGPSYNLVDFILTRMNESREQGLSLLQEEDEKLLTEALARGVELDQEQLTLLRQNGQAVVERIEKVYQEPYWKKTCQVTKGPVSPRLQSLAFGLNLDPSQGKDKASLCHSLEKLATAEPDKLVSAAVKRQQERISASVSEVTEYIDNEGGPAFVCRNRSLLPHDPYEYADEELASYRDEQGVVWCFTSNMFETLIGHGLNPYTNQKLPSSFLHQLTSQLAKLKQLKVDYSNPVTFEETITRLRSPDVITNEESDKILRQFIQLGERNGIMEEQLKQISVDKMKEGLRALGYQVQLPKNSPGALRDTAWVVVTASASKPEVATRFFTAIKQN